MTIFDQNHQCERPPGRFRGLDLDVIEEIAPGVTWVRDRYQDMATLARVDRMNCPLAICRHLTIGVEPPPQKRS